MEDFVEQLSRGNVEEVKVVLASVVAALAIYQVLLMFMITWLTSAGDYLRGS